MPPEGAPYGEPIHATVVSIDGRALVIRGPSGSGKSALAAALVASSGASRRVVLVGDDRVMLRDLGGGDVSVRPHPRIAGFIERRGFGLVAMPYAAEARVAGLVELEAMTTKPRCLENFPVLSIVDEADATSRRDRVLDWWSRLASAADGSHVVAKVALTPATCAEDYIW